MSAVAALIHLAGLKGVRFSLAGDEIKVAGKREDVTTLLTPLREHREELRRWLQADSANDEQIDQSASSDDWRNAAGRYYSHHFGCATCIAASRQMKLRCPKGLELWGNYLAAINHEDGKGLVHGQT